MTRVLLVDDAADCTEMFGVLLDMLGHEHAEANDGGAALAIAAAWHPALVLLDVAMPGMSGVEVCRRLRAVHGKTMRIIAVTGHTRAPGSDFDECVLKPMDADTLKRLLSECT